MKADIGSLAAYMKALVDESGTDDEKRAAIMAGMDRETLAKFVALFGGSVESDNGGNKQ